MTYKLNGINYSEMLLTDEELAVVKAMREEDAKINVFVNRNNEKEAKEYAKSFPNRKVIFDLENKDFFYSSTVKTSVYASYEKKQVM